VLDGKLNAYYGLFVQIKHAFVNPHRLYHIDPLVPNPRTAEKLANLLK
jgi:hypothetical protein